MKISVWIHTYNFVKGIWQFKHRISSISAKIGFETFVLPTEISQRLFPRGIYRMSHLIHLAYLPVRSRGSITDWMMEYYVKTLLGGIWFVLGTLLLYLGWSSPPYASVFRTSLSVTMGVILVLGGSAFLLHSYGFGLGDWAIGHLYCADPTPMILADWCSINLKNLLVNYAISVRIEWSLCDRITNIARSS